MTTPTYPEELPVPSQFKLTPFPQVLASNTDIGPKAFRRRSRQPSAFAAVEFRYLETEYSVFVEWFKTDLLYGHKWFWIPLPSPNGLVPLQARFTAKPTATLGGHRFWTVTGILELPDRFATITYEMLTSLVYPIEVVESIDTDTHDVSGSITDSVGHIDVTSDFISGTVEVTISYESITADSEAVDVTTDLLEGTVTVTISYESIDADFEAIDVASDLVSGTVTITIIYVSHSDSADDEELDVSTDLISGTLI